MTTRTRSRSRVELLVEQIDDILHRLDRLQLLFGDLEIHVLLESDREIDEVEAVELQVLDEPGGGHELLVPQLESVDQHVTQALEDFNLGHFGLRHECSSSAPSPCSKSACRSAVSRRAASGTVV